MNTKNISIIKYSGLVLKMETKEFKAAKTLANEMYVSVTGARPGDTLVGARPATKNSIMIVKGHIKPYRKDLEKIMAFPSIWTSFLTKLRSFPFFNTMTVENIEDWLKTNSIEKDLYISEYNVEIEIIELGAILDKMNKELLPDPSLLRTGAQIEGLIPSKPGSKAKHHTLVMKTDFWRIGLDYMVDKNVGNIPSVNLSIVPKEAVETIVIKNFLKLSEDEYQDYSISFPKHRPSIDLHEIIHHYNVPEKHLNIVNDAMRCLTPAAYKSLIQKLIRFQANFVRIGNEVLPTRNVFIVSYTKLVLEPGSFVPDIQRYVTGLESATKRLAVTLIEDSYAEPEDVQHLFLCALLSQRVKWQPGSNLLKHWIDIGLKGLECRKKFVYIYKDGSKISPYYFQINGERLKNCSALLDELKSFETDLYMARDIGNKQQYIENEYVRPEVMNFEHFVDHHWVPNIAYFRSLMTEFNEVQNIGSPFDSFFKHLWKYSSSLNPRIHEDFHDIVDSMTYKNIQKIQRYALLYKQIEKRESRKNLKAKETMTFEIDKGWLSALVGTIPVAVNGLSSYVTIKTDKDFENIDHSYFVAIKTPSREVADKQLTEEEQEIAIDKAMEILKTNGIAMNKAVAPYSVLENCKLFLENGRWKIVNSAGKEVKWTDKFDVTLDVLKKQTVLNIDDAIVKATVQESTTGIIKNHKVAFKHLLSTLDGKTRIIKRILMYLNSYSSKFELNKVSMDGSGTYKSVSCEDSDAFLFFVYLSMIYPCAISPVNLGTFVSHCPPLLWKIRDEINKYVSNNVYVKWPYIEDIKKRQLWVHQKHILSEMMKNSQRPGHFMWLKVGMGKTLIVLTYIQWLNEHQKLPEYVVYTVPKSAMRTIVSEIKTFGIPINLLIPTKTVSEDYVEIINENKNYNFSVSRNCDCKKHAVNIVTSDNHLRLANEKLLEIAPKSLFIVDEVHKTLNETQRTSAALELASVADKFITFTGTPIIDTHTYKLAWWLEKIVPFEVNENNFWVASNTMIAKIADTGIETEYEQFLAKIENEELYYSLVPPSLGGSNFNASMSHLKKATDISYNSATTSMIKLAIKYAKKGVVVVAKDKKHQDVIYSELVKKIEPSKVLLMTDSVNLTSEDKGPVQIVIVPIKKSEGYNLTKMSVMISSVYPSNQATRTQIEGRINRIGQTADKLLYVKVHCGTLTRIMNDHNTAKNLNSALEAMHT